MAELESALATLRDHDRPEFSTHGPMAVEALECLGLAHLAPAWARAYRVEQGLAPIPLEAPLSDAELESSLGDEGKRGAWIARMDRELEENPWQDVARRWLPRLVPAASCDAAHGLIRVSHALRSLGRSETPERVHELAEAIAYWASAYREIPGKPGRGTPALASQAIATVPTVPVSEQVWQGSITDRVNALVHLAGFEEAVSALAPGDDFALFADDLALTSARLYLANADRARTIDFIHAVDGVYAVRELLPYLDTNTGRDLLFYGWQTVAALHASGGGPLEPNRVQAPAPAEIPALVDRAIEVGGAHAIKFAQACLAEYQNQPDPLFHAALADMVIKMEELKERLGLVI